MDKEIIKKETIKKTCNCGRKLIVKRQKHGNTPNPVCTHCKQYGQEESRRQNLSVHRKLNNTIYK